MGLRPENYGQHATREDQRGTGAECAAKSCIGCALDSREMVEVGANLANTIERIVR